MQEFSPLNLTPEELIAFTHEWTGDRSEEGDPRVPDSMLERMREVTITEAWQILHNEGYQWQYTDDWQCTHPGQILVGRALTAVYMPRRPGISRVMEARGKECGCVGDQISWPIDMLTPGDVYVADVFGKIARGPIIDDNLATSIYAKSGNGVVHAASVRDLGGIQSNPGFTSFVRGWRPTYAAATIMLMGVNTPMRIGGATVIPGDVVLGRDDGVTFVPPHLAEKAVKTSELVRLRD